MKKRDMVLALVMIPFILFSFAIFFFVNDSTSTTLGGEDGVFETIGVIGLVFGTVLLWIQFRRDHSGNDLFLLRTKKNYFLLFTAFLFAFGAVEEISWGQRLLHLNTPDYFRQHNLQDEINIHNLEPFQGYNGQKVFKTGLDKILTANFLFNIYWSLFCVVIPLANKFSQKISAFLKRINFPVYPIWVGVLFLVVLLLARLTEPRFQPPVSYYINEVKECDFEILLGFSALCWFLDARNELLKPIGPQPARQ